VNAQIMNTADSPKAALSVAWSRLRVILLVEIALLIVFAVLPAFLEFFWVVFATRVMILGLLALSIDLIWGYAGILCFGQALFFGGAAYTVAVCARDLGIDSVFIVLPASILVGMVLALLLGWFVLLGRLSPSPIFVALGTLTGTYVAERLALGWYYLGGQNGIPSIPPMTAGRHVLNEGVEYYYLALGILVLVYLFCRWLMRSQFGLVLAGIRQREHRITFLGYRPETFKIVTFALSGGIAGLAGGLIAFHDGFVWPNLLGVVLSTQVVLYVLLGGMGTLIGGIIGVAAIEIASFHLAERLPGYWPIALGLLMLLLILFRPSGLLGLVVPQRERVGSFGWRGSTRGGKEADGDAAA
jgi:urea transport system permease protein